MKNKDGNNLIQSKLTASTRDKSTLVATSTTSSRDTVITTRKKSAVKPCFAPPPPPAKHSASITPKDTAVIQSQLVTTNGVLASRDCQSITQLKSSHETNKLHTKPAIMSPKPRIKQTAPLQSRTTVTIVPSSSQTIPPNSVTVSANRDESFALPPTTEATPAESFLGKESDFSDVMRDVLKVLDRKDVVDVDGVDSFGIEESKMISLNEEHKDASVNNTVGFLNDPLMNIAEETSEKQSDIVTKTSKTVNDTTSHNTNSSMPPQPNKDSFPVDNVTNQNISKSTHVNSTELKIDIPDATANQIDPDAIDFISRREKLPKRRVRRHKTAIGLMLCCGLGRSILRDKHSPPFELPLRTEGAGLRSSVSPTASHNSDLMTSSHSPKQLQQSDVTGSNTQLQQSDVNGSNTQLKQNDASTTVTPTVPDLTVTDNSTVDSSACANPVIITPTGSGSNNDVTRTVDTKTQQQSSPKERSIIDVLCEREKPISISHKDNKDLVVASSSSSQSSSRTNIDVTTRPVVHGVILSKTERMFPSFAAGIAGPITPRSSRTFSHFTESHSSNSAHESKHGEDTTTTAVTAALSDVTDTTNNSLPEMNPLRSANKRGLERQRSQSLEDITVGGNDAIHAIHCDLINHLQREDGSYRSSFIGRDAEVQKSAIIKAPGEVQTLLKHSKIEGEVYALPQPACYSDDTLRAVKLITDKYDTLERWKIRAVSFRSDDTMRKNSEHALQFKYNTINQQNSQENKCDEITEESQSHNVTDSSDATQTGSNSTTTCTNNQTEHEPLLTQGCNVTNNETVVKHHELSPEEMSRIALFYSSRDTSVTVANTVVNLLLSAKEVERASDVTEWTHAQSGVPVLVLTTGDGRRRRELTLVIADRETSFPLWQDIVNHLSRYETLKPDHHSMHLSKCLLKVAAFKFFDVTAAETFMEQFQTVTQDPNDDLWKVRVPMKKMKKTKDKKKHIKGDISQPIQFNHVTNVSASDSRTITDNISIATSHNDSSDSQVVFEFRPRSNSQ